MLDKECGKCKFFEYEGPCGKGRCELNVRNGVTYAQYICRKFEPRLDANGISDPLYGQRIATGFVAPKRDKKPIVDDRNSVQTNDVRVSRDSEIFKEKRVNYDVQ